MNCSDMMELVMSFFGCSKLDQPIRRGYSLSSCRKQRPTVDAALASIVSAAFPSVTARQDRGGKKRRRVARYSSANG